MTTLPPKIATLKMTPDVRRQVQELFDYDVEGEDPKSCSIRSCYSFDQVSGKTEQVLLDAAKLTGPADELSAEELHLVRELMDGQPAWSNQIGRLARWFVQRPSGYAYDQLSRVETVVKDAHRGQQLIIKNIILRASHSDYMGALNGLNDADVSTVADQILTGKLDDEIADKVTSNYFQATADTPPVEAQGRARDMALFALARTGADDPLLLRTVHDYTQSSNPKIVPVQQRLEAVITAAKYRLGRLVQKTAGTTDAVWAERAPSIEKALMFNVIVDDPALAERFRSDPQATSLLVIQDICHQTVAIFRGDIQQPQENDELKLADNMIRAVKEQIAPPGPREPVQPARPSPGTPRIPNWAGPGNGVPG